MKEKEFAHSPFADIYIPYIVEPQLPRKNSLRFIWEVIKYAPISNMARWVLYRTIRLRAAE
jgi:hypothetical protein